MNPKLLFVQEQSDDNGDILWSYWTRDKSVVAISYDHRAPVRLAELNGLEIKWLVS